MKKSSLKPSESRKPGPVREYFVYKLIPGSGRGSKRDLVFNTRDADIVHSLFRLFGAGRFRIEGRDDRRLVASVCAVLVQDNGVTIQSPPRSRPIAVWTVAPPEPIPSLPPDERLIERDGVERGDDPLPPQGVIEGPPGNRRDPRAITRWVLYVANAVAGAWASADDAICEMLHDLSEQDRREAQVFLRLHKNVHAECARYRSLATSVHSRDDVSKWVERLYVWATREIYRARRWLDQKEWIEARATRTLKK